MQYNNQQRVETLFYWGTSELIPGPLKKLVFHMVLMPATFSAPLMLFCPAVLPHIHEYP